MNASFSDDELTSLFSDLIPDDPVALAVSGGGDSVALLALMRRWGHVPVTVLTVDHGLRAESAGEAAMVARACAEYGIDHEILHWDEQGQGNLADRARVGRYTLMAQACRARGIGTLVTGHTLDDQAETVLMRLGRGSGVDGLAGIRPVSDLWGLCVVRPLMGVSRERLRAFLRAEGIAWVDDPSNQDRSRMRIQARDALVALAPLGINPERLVQTANWMADAQCVLDAEADRLAARACVVSPLGYVTLDPVAMVDARRDTGLRLLSRVLCAVSGQAYRPRLSSLTALRRDLGGMPFTGQTLHGCRIDPHEGGVVVQREASACAAFARVTSSRIFWDDRFEIVVPDGLVADPELRIGATGDEGLKVLKTSKIPVFSAWKAAPRPARLAAPAIWRGEALVGIPLAGYAADPVVAGCVVSSLVTIGTAAVDPDAGAFI